MSILRPCIGTAGTLLMALALVLPAHADMARAYAALQRGRVDEASALLRGELAANPSSLEAHLLLCRAAYAQEEADNAIEECRRAAAQAASDSVHGGAAEMWLGRALGMKADHSNPIAAINLARQVRAAFERAVQLDPGNIDAVSDLGEYCVNAPGFLGGSTDRVRQLAASIQTLSPARAHRLVGLAAEKDNRLSAAEAEFKAAADADKDPEAYIDLALFYQRQKRLDEMVAAVTAALAADRRHGPAAVDAASILTVAHCELPVAMQALRAYLRSDYQTDAAPVFKVHVQLGNLLAKNKDKEGARREYNEAIALAANYAPAHKALDRL